jgi:hypothetical protein
MPTALHAVSFRNGSQIMVRGLRLGEALGYCRNARVQVTDFNRNAANEPWVFVVPNDEHATLACTEPPPPSWIQPGVMIRIEVDPPLGIDAEPVSNPGEATDRVANVGSVVSPVRKLPPHSVYAVDVGSPGAGLAWARLAPHTGESVRGSMNFSHFLDRIVQDLRAGVPVALGFEAPMFLPVAADIGNLTRARTAEPAAWSFGAGAYVTTVAIPLMAYTLRHIRSNLETAPNVTLDSNEWLKPGSAGSHLFLWEAFVTGAAHARETNEAGIQVHLIDAATAVLSFIQWESTIPRENSHVTAENAISTVGAAVLWSGLARGEELLHRQTMVLRPRRLLGGDVATYEPPSKL